MADGVVGRELELDAVARFVERAGRERAALVLEGEAGIGKSTIWESAVSGARVAGFRVLRSRPARSEQGLTLGGLTDLFGDLPDDVLAGLPDPQRAALEVALLRAMPGGTAPDQRTLAVAVAGVLRLLANERPVLVALDDAQWLDGSSVGIISYAIRRLADRPIGLLVSIRTGPDGGSAPELLAAVDADHLEHVVLGPLPLASLHRLFEHRLGRSFPRIELLRIEAASDGNPLYALEIARALASAMSASDPHDGLPVPGSLGLLLAERVSGLPPETRRAMLLAAAAVEPTLQTLDRADPGVSAALAPAIDGGLVAVERGSVRFGHPLFAQVVVRLASADELRAAHATLAAASSSADARARHLGLAATGPDETVAAALADAAAVARDRGATLDASALFREASAATPPDRGEARLDRARLAAECLFVDLSEYVEADRILEAAIGAAPPGPSRADALSLRAILRYYHGQVPQAAALGEEALAEVGEDPGLRARVLGRLGYLVMQLDLERGIDLVDAAVSLLEGQGAAADPDTLANAVLLRANAELGLVRPTRPGELERGLALISADGRSWEKEGAEGNAFGYARHTDDLAAAIGYIRRMIHEKSGPGGDDPFNLVQLSGLLLAAGDWPEARRQAEAALEAYVREGAEVHPAWALRGVALVAAHDGRLDDARRWATEGLERAAERGDAIVALFHHHILGFVAMATDDWPEADRRLASAAELGDRVGVRHPGRFKLAGDRVETALALGDPERAAEIVRRLDEAIAVAPTPWVRAVGARSAALLAASRGDGDAAATAFDAAIAAHGALQMPFERARTLLAKGRFHRRRKEKRLADETLRAALAIFEELGAPTWAAATRAELGRVGLRPRAPTDLTETERRVAELAATGLSSRQIADRAFLAPKTVGNVLGRVYEKLGIHSRAELGALMAGEASAVGADGDDGRETDPTH